jgi:hypothetical protein
MENYNAVFLVGGPGSGKDFLLRTALKESGATEFPLAKLIDAIAHNKNVETIDGRPLIVNGTAESYTHVHTSKAVLEAMGYQTAMVFVYTDNQASFLRSGNILESRRASRYEESIKSMHEFKDLFGEGFFLFDNSNDFVKANEETQAQIVSWLQELNTLVEGYFEKPVMGIRSPKVPKPVGGEPKGGHDVPAGYERVKDGSFNVLRKKKPVPLEGQNDTSNIREDVDILFEKEFPTIVDMIAQKKDKKGVSQGDKYKGGIAVPGNKATSREVVESAEKHLITFSHNNCSYRVHKLGCPAAKEGKHRTVWEHEGDAHSALQACHNDESEKAGKPTKANAAICKCAKPVSESNQEIKVTQTQAKGVKYRKDRPAKGARPPGDYFDGRMGAVPSGGIGLTAYKEETTPKSLKDIRRK